jgi:hypothetical protein
MKQKRVATNKQLSLDLVARSKERRDLIKSGSVIDSRHKFKSTVDRFREKVITDLYRSRIPK